MANLTGILQELETARGKLQKELSSIESAIAALQGGNSRRGASDEYNSPPPFYVCGGASQDRRCPARTLGEMESGKEKGRLTSVRMDRRIKKPLDSPRASFSFYPAFPVATAARAITGMLMLQLSSVSRASS